MKKILINIILIILAFIIYFLQCNFFSWFTIAGVKPNMFVIFILFIGLFGNKTMGMTYGAIIGVILDLIFYEKVGVNLIGLTIIGFLAILFDRNFSKDSRITIMFMTFGITIIYEVLIYCLNYLLFDINIDILSFIKILTIEVIYNIIIIIIIYPLIQKLGYFLENQYKNNTILTRYF